MSNIILGEVLIIVMGRIMYIGGVPSCEHRSFIWLCSIYVPLLLWLIPIFKKLRLILTKLKMHLSSQQLMHKDGT